MILLPAIDLREGKCVRLTQGDYQTAQVVAEDPVETALGFQAAGARWLHLVDLDGAKDGRPVNRELILQVAAQTDLNIEVGGGIRDLDTAAAYLESGVSRVILGSAALGDPAFVREAVRRWGRRVAVGIDARDGKVAAQGWLETSQVDFLDFAKEMEAAGVGTLIVTDISRDGAMRGPNLEMLDRVNRAVSCEVVASGGVRNVADLRALRDLGLYGAIAGKALYRGTLSLPEALAACRGPEALDRFFQKGELIPAVVQEAGTGKVLMLAYMNRESLRRTLDTGETWFYSRSRQRLWHKGETSGHFQRVRDILADCDDDTLLLLVEQTGAACHTGRHSCFFQRLTAAGDVEIIEGD